jgi:uncharacterized protein YdeI (YjbR/CyaY-like superfamily)
LQSVNRKMSGPANEQNCQRRATKHNMKPSNTKNVPKSVSAENREAWRRWLEKNHDKAGSVRLVIFNKRSGKPGVTYVEAVEEALCFGWIDSTGLKRDNESYLQHFARRKPKSNWSTLNRGRAKRLVKEGRMAPAGLAMINLAKRTGTWKATEHVENSVVPDDLRMLFARNKRALKNFETFPPSSKRIILSWIFSAKTAGTRSRRVKETVTLASKNIRANHYRRPVTSARKRGAPPRS